jgi:phosphatidylglycerophosphate synthase
VDPARFPSILTASRLALGPLHFAVVASLGEAAFAPAPGATAAHGGQAIRAPLLGALPLAVAALASLTDFTDGRLARALGAVSTRGAALDVAADAAFLLFALVALAGVGAISWSLPVAAAASLAALAMRWRVRAATGASSSPASAAPRALPDAVGHAAGILNYGAVLVASAIPLGLASPAWVVPASALVAAVNLAPIALRAIGR